MVRLVAALGASALAMAFVYNVDDSVGVAIVGGGTVAGRFGRDRGQRFWRDVTILYMGAALVVAQVR